MAHAPAPPVDARRPVEPDLTILERQVYRGPNYWSYDPAVRLLVDLGSLEDWPSDSLPGFVDRLLELLPGVGEHSCSTGERGGFGERLRAGTWLGHVAEHVALELQHLAGSDVRRGKTRSAGPPGRYHVLYGYHDETVGLAAGELAVRLINHLVATGTSAAVERDLDPHAEIEALIRLAERVAFGPSTQAIVDEAVSRDIPFIRLDRYSLVQLGQGVHQRRIRATMTSSTSWLGVDIAGNKELTNRLLSDAGLPVPASRTAVSPDAAVAAAEAIGYPVVVKPLDGNHGRGVRLHLTSPEQVRDAYAVAEAESRRGDVVVESHVDGRDYRFLVVGGRMVAVAERVPAHVTGDGTHTVRELVERANADPDRGVGHEKVLTRIPVDEAAVALVRRQGYELDEVPPEGTEVRLTLTANMSTGGTSVDRTGEAHPDNIDIAEEAARVVGLDIAGIDFIAPDITEPVRERGGAIVEVNAAPGFRMHTHPTTGDAQFVAKPVVDLLFPPGSPSRIPIVSVTGTNGKTTTARMVAHVFKRMGRKVGLTSTDGIVIDERLVVKADASGPRSARMVLQNPRVDLAVFEVARGGLLREGLGYERNDVAVVLNVTADHLGRHGIDTLEELAAVKRIVVEAVPRDGYAVLNADDPLVAAMRRHCRGEIILFSFDPDNELVDRHVARDGWAVTLGHGDLGEMVVIRQGRRSMPLAYTHQLPITYGGHARMNVQNLMAATGAALGAGAHLHDIRQALRTFSPSYEVSAGRLNLIDVRGVQVLIDYAHNPAGLEALVDFVGRLTDTPPGGDLVVHRRIGVIAMPGDRRDEDLRAFGRIAGDHFDQVIVREDDRLRGRQPGQSAALVAAGVRAAMDGGGRCRTVEIILDELTATRTALERANPGDLVVATTERTAEVWDELQHRARGTEHTSR